MRQEIEALGTNPDRRPGPDKTGVEERTVLLVALGRVNSDLIPVRMLRVQEREA